MKNSPGTQCTHSFCYVQQRIIHQFLLIASIIIRSIGDSDWSELKYEGGRESREKEIVPKVPVNRRHFLFEDKSLECFKLRRIHAEKNKRAQGFEGVRFQGKKQKIFFYFRHLCPLAGYSQLVTCNLKLIPDCTLCLHLHIAEPPICSAYAPQRLCSFGEILYLQLNSNRIPGKQGRPYHDSVSY